MISIKDIAWLAGLIEGEGYIGFNETPSIKISMTDKDVVEKAASLFNRPLLEVGTTLDRKRVYRIMIHGTPAVEWLFTIYSFLGKRRKEKALEVISLWKPQKSVSRDKNLFRCGHPKSSDNTWYNRRTTYCKTCRVNKRNALKVNKVSQNG